MFRSGGLDRGAATFARACRRQSVVLVVDLTCSRGHRFEAWAKDDASLSHQLGSASMSCPVCGEHALQRMPSAPHVASRRAVAREEGAESSALAATLRRALSALAHDSEDVGERFADEARRMHYDQIEARPIRGTGTPEQLIELLEEGIPVLPVPDADDTLH